MAVDGRGNILVTDTVKCSLQVFDKNGQFIKVRILTDYSYNSRVVVTVKFSKKETISTHCRITILSCSRMVGQEPGTMSLITLRAFTLMTFIR